MMFGGKRPRIRWWYGAWPSRSLGENYRNAWYIGYQRKTILDVGCNQGGFLRKLYDTTPFKEGVGIDLARLSLEKAETLKGERPLTYYLTDKPQETNRTFDTAVSTSVLYLIEDIPQHAQDLKEVLKPGGVYYASFADLTNNPSRQFMDDTINQYGATPSQNHSLKHIVDSFVDAGFEVAVMKRTCAWRDWFNTL